MRRAAFLDLNGTLVRPVAPERLADLAPFPGVFEAITRLCAAGLVCPVITVQSRIAKGFFTLQEFTAWFERFSAECRGRGATVVGPYVCPHRFAEPCPCKKPQTTLYLRAAIEHDIDVAASFVVGDSPDDMRAARRLGARSCLVCASGVAGSAVSGSDPIEGDAVVTSFSAAVDWILGQPARRRAPE